ncbi:MAG: SCO family protein [Verrucomicrobiota bacterium]
MRSWLLTLSILSSASLLTFSAKSASPSASLPLSLPAPSSDPAVRVFPAHGVVEELKPADQIVVIKHGAISNYMDAMTMPFKVKDPGELAGLQRGSLVNFELHVGASESWVAKIVRTGTVSLPPLLTNAVATVSPNAKYELLHYKFTNELGQAVSLSDFPGQALAITFFYTRCPLPDFCPRQSKNFEEASHQLAALTNAPANWHFISVSFDPEFDSPEVLKAYARFYQYDPAHWSFLTGPKDKIHELAATAGVVVQNSDGAINHNMRTLIIDANGHLQTVFPFGGNLSAEIVAQIIKAAAVTNTALAQNQNR